ncbi:uncharacterized protein LOC141685749 [Apium graveolens]|uniref:uncharacterized protein LOC141685749 n=1 Tax=Apium graveolens TaxID=4045 RepID=UPI003D7B8C3B
MDPPHCIKDFQKLTGRITALGSFISKLGDKCLPFFNTLKKVKNFEWTDESQYVFEQLKKYITEAPLLAKPILEDILYLYLTVSEQARQRSQGQEIVAPEGKEKDKDEDLTLKEYWVLHFDGASKTKSSGAGLVLQSSERFMIEYTLKLDFPTMKNEAEYETLIVGLGLARAVRAKNLKVCRDSRLVISQVNGEFEAKDDTVSKYLRVVKEILIQFDEWYAEHVPEGFRANKCNGNDFEEYCNDNNIELRFTSVAHPLENGQEEVSNRIILEGLKKKVECSRNTWVDELLSILWAYRTTCRVTTEVTQFMLAYGAEAVVPVKFTHGSPRVEPYELENNEEGMRLALDLIDEIRDDAN